MASCVQDDKPSDAVASGGVQSVHRAALLLRALTSTPATGARLRDLAEQLSLDRTTVHRLMQTLVEERLVEQDPTTKRYHLGLDFFALAAAAANRYDIQEIARSAVIKLAESLGDSVFFSLRSHGDAICIEANKGTYPVRVLAMDIGARTPLGAGATGIALLAPLPDDEIQEILRVNATRLQRYQGHAPERIAAAIQRYREVGFAFEDGRANNGVHAIAVPLPDRRGRPLSALTIAASADRMPLHRRPAMAAALQAEGERISEAMWRKPDTSRHRLSWVAATKST